MTEAKIEFIIVGDDFPPEEITDILKLTPSKAYKTNEVFMIGPEKNIPRKRTECCWMIETDYTNTIDVEGELRKLYDLIKDKKNELVEISRRFNVENKFCIVINFRNENPIIGIEKDIVKFASDINAWFEFDTYV